MAIKMRVLYDSPKKGMQQIAAAIKEKYELPVNAVDGKFPPAYPCDRERIVILGMSAKKDIADHVRLFCGQLNKSRAANVALLIDGDEAACNKLAAVLNAAGTNLVGTKIINLGGFGPFGGACTNEMKDEILVWVEAMVGTCK